jgi:N6-L-threonylcarbamoyladenine synthase
MLGLAYPAGAVIDRLAKDGDKDRFAFPRALKQRVNFDFSFSGVKTSVLTHLEKHGLPEGAELHDLCASFQEAICDSLVTKAIRAATAAGRTRLGVAANSRLRALVEERGRAAGLDVHVPPVKLCTDNGAMIALAGWHRFAARGADALTLNANAAWRM